MHPISQGWGCVRQAVVPWPCGPPFIPSPPLSLVPYSPDFWFWCQSPLQVSSFGSGDEAEDVAVSSLITSFLERERTEHIVLCLGTTKSVPREVAFWSASSTLALGTRDPRGTRTQRGRGAAREPRSLPPTPLLQPRLPLHCLGTAAAGRADPRSGGQHRGLTRPEDAGWIAAT